MSGEYKAARYLCCGLSIAGSDGGLDGVANVVRVVGGCEWCEVRGGVSGLREDDSATRPASDVPA